MTEDKCWNCRRAMQFSTPRMDWQGHTVCPQCERELLAGRPARGKDLDRCGQCRREIEATETPHVFEQRIVCEACDRELRDPKRRAKCHLCGGKMQVAQVPAFPNSRYAGLAILLAAMMLLLFVSTAAGTLLLPVWLVATVLLHQRKTVLRCDGCGMTMACS